MPIPLPLIVAAPGQPSPLQMPEAAIEAQRTSVGTPSFRRELNGIYSYFMQLRRLFFALERSFAIPSSLLSRIVSAPSASRLRGMEVFPSMRARRDSDRRLTFR